MSLTNRGENRLKIAHDYANGEKKEKIFKKNIVGNSYMLIR